METVTITGGPLSIDELLAVVDGAPLGLGSDARTTIEASHAVIEAALAGREAVYGLTTQVGHGKDELLTEEQLGRQQRMLVLTHSGGLGAPLPTRVVRAALTARVNGIARGGSGASMAAADVLVAMVNAGVHPLVPETEQLAAPATLDTPPLNMSVEDHGTAAPLGVRKTERALELLEDLLAVERMLAHDLLSMLPSMPALGAGTSAALQEVEDAIAAREPYPDDVHRALRA